MIARTGLALVALLALAGCGGREGPETLVFADPATALNYEVVLEGAPDEAVAGLMENSLAIFRQQEDGAQSQAFLRRRLINDEPTAARILRSVGFFEGRITHRIEMLPTDPDAPRQALVTVTVEPGRPFMLSRHDFIVTDDGGVPVDLPMASALGSPVNEPAIASRILGAEELAVKTLRQRGRPYASTIGREAVADLDLAELQIDSTISAGNFYTMEMPRFEGLERVDEDYLLTYLNWEPGDPYDQRAIDAFQRDLADTRLFRSISVRPPQTGPDGDRVPITVSAEEGPRRSVSAGARFSTDRGPAVSGTFEHRNMFGANETGSIDALAGLDEQRVEFRYLEPQFLRNQQDFVAGLELRRIEDDAFDELALTTTAGIKRTLSSRWEVGAGGLFEVTQTTETGEDTLFYLFGLPLVALYDGSDDLLNPTKGSRLEVLLTPFAGFSDDGDNPLFTSLDTRGSHYIALDEAGNYVLAGRARVGIILADVVDDVPAPRRLYAGGGGSVRGYEERSIGPEDEDGDPLGGLSATELGVEFRARLFGDIGGAVFVEGGAVSEEPYFLLEDFSVGYGGGVRYFSPVGPIRLDVGVPLNPDDDDDDFQIYISIGQAF